MLATPDYHYSHVSDYADDADDEFTFSPLITPLITPCRFSSLLRLIFHFIIYFRAFAAFHTS